MLLSASHAMRIWPLLLLAATLHGQTADSRPRARDLGLVTGSLPTGPDSAITDVAGVRVGHSTLIRGDNVRTGVTAILPHGGNLFQQKARGAVFIGNAFGKLAGSTQVNELGEIETPILLTSTLNVPRVADALIDYMLALEGHEEVRSINPLVGETNDGRLNDIRGRHVGREQVFEAIGNARSGPVAEGCAGAGTGTTAFGFKAGIGTSSRQVDGGYTAGVLVQSHFGGDLRINGAPVGRELRGTQRNADADGSIMVVVATDAPLEHRNLKRLAARAMLGLGRTGAAGSNGSGGYVIAFSTSQASELAPNQRISPLFLAAIEATEGLIYNPLFAAETMTGSGVTVEALPLDRTVEILKRYGAPRN